MISLNKQEHTYLFDSKQRPIMRSTKMNIFIEEKRTEFKCNEKYEEIILRKKIVN